MRSQAVRASLIASLTSRPLRHAYRAVHVDDAPGLVRACGPSPWRGPCEQFVSGLRVRAVTVHRAMPCPSARSRSPRVTGPFRDHQRVWRCAARCRRTATPSATTRLWRITPDAKSVGSTSAVARASSMSRNPGSPSERFVWRRDDLRERQRRSEYEVAHGGIALARSMRCANRIAIGLAGLVVRQEGPPAGATTRARARPSTDRVAFAYQPRRSADAVVVGQRHQELRSCRMARTTYRPRRRNRSRNSSNWCRRPQSGCGVAAEQGARRDSDPTVWGRWRKLVGDLAGLLPVISWPLRMSRKVDHRPARMCQS